MAWQAEFSKLGMQRRRPSVAALQRRFLPLASGSFLETQFSVELIDLKLDSFENIFCTRWVDSGGFSGWHQS